MIHIATWGWSSSPLSIYAWGWDEVGALNVLTGIPHFVFDDFAWPIVHSTYRPQSIGHGYQAGRTVRGESVAHVAMSYGSYSVNHAAGTGARINREASVLTMVRGATHGGRISRGDTATRVSTEPTASIIDRGAQTTPKIIH